MKTLWCIVLCLMLALVAACGNEGSQETSATVEPANSAKAPETAPPPAANLTPAEPRPAAPAPAAAKPDVEKPAAPRTAEVPRGTNVTVVLTDAISTGTNKTGDTFRASLAAPLVVNGQTVAEKGSTVMGRVVEAEGAGRVKGTASIRLALTSLTAGSKTYPISTSTYAAEAEATKKRDAGVIAGGSGVGAAIGAIAGGGKGAVKGAIIGGAAGTGAVLATKGKEVELDSESRLTFSLTKPVELPISR